MLVILSEAKDLFFPRMAVYPIIEQQETTEICRRTKDGPQRFPLRRSGLRQDAQR
jgi:hypothetical protein